MRIIGDVSNDIKAIPIDLVIAYNKSYSAISDEYELRDLARASKVIGGGQVKIPSVKLSQWDRQASIKNFESDSIFTEFTAEQLAQINAELEFGEEAMFIFLEDRCG